jgi:hypothetical protein
LVLREDLIWLLSEREPWVRYCTLVDLSDLPEDDPKAVAASQAVLEHPKVKRLNNDAKHPIHKLALLADDPGMGEVVEKVMAHRSPEGAFQTVVLVPKALRGTGKGKRR